MTPTITSSIMNSTHLPPLTNKLRKPIVERMRRGRINSSIEKLKSLLGGEFLKQQPESRQEKEDILEMTFYFLKQQQQKHKSRCSTATEEGYSRCLQEGINFLSWCGVHTQSQRSLLSHPFTMQPSTENTRNVLPRLSSPACQTSSKAETPSCGGLWRPWLGPVDTLPLGKQFTNATLVFTTVS